MTGPPPGIEPYIHSHSNDYTNCPDCSRYVGPLEFCPYCRAHHNKRLILRLAKYASPIIGIIGILVLGYLGKTIGNPMVKVSSLTEQSNFAYVQLEGVVCDTPRLYHASGSDDPTAGTLQFCLDDGTARTRVKTYEDATRRIVKAGKIPAVGDRVHVMGNFQIRMHRHSLVVGAPEELTITRPPPLADYKPRDIATAARDGFNEFDRVRVVGKVYRSYVRREGKRKDGKSYKNYEAKIRLSAGKIDGKWANVDVVIPWTVLELAGAILPGDPKWEGAPPSGSRVSVTGALRYEDTSFSKGWRLYLADPGEIELLEQGK